MSKFGTSVPFLAEATGAPLFARMLEEKRAYPMAVGITRQILPLVKEGGRQRTRQMVRRLCHSKRYLLACMADGAQRFNADGTPAGEVTEKEKAFAAEARERQAAHGTRMKAQKAKPAEAA